MTFILVGVIVLAGTAWVVWDYRSSRRSEPPWLKKMREHLKRDRGES